MGLVSNVLELYPGKIDLTSGNKAQSGKKKRVWCKLNQLEETHLSTQ